MSQRQVAVLLLVAIAVLLFAGGFFIGRATAPAPRVVVERDPCSGPVNIFDHLAGCP